MWTAENGPFRNADVKCMADVVSLSVYLAVQFTALHVSYKSWCCTFLSPFSEQREIIKLHSVKFRFPSLNIQLRIALNSMEIDINSFLIDVILGVDRKHYKFPNLFSAGSGNNVRMLCHSSRADTAFRFQNYPD